MERLIYNARLHAVDMLRDRGYHFEENVKNMPFPEFQEKWARKSQVDLYAEKLTDAEDRIYVKFYQSHSTRKLSSVNLEKECTQIAQALEQKDKYENTFRIIFVCEESPQSNVELILRYNYKNVEVMTFNQLQFNPTKHFLVPKHEILDKDQETAVMGKYNVIRKNLTKEFPRILSSDPIARWYGMKPGSICRIQRVSEQSGRAIHYRVVV